jgi:hypothetical protein
MRTHKLKGVIMNKVEEQDATRFLRQSLRGNAFFSTASGLVFMAASGAIADFLGGMPSILVAVVGGQLLLFAGALFWLASRPEISKQLVLAVIVADILWVVGTIVVVYVDLFTRDGAALAIALASVVLLLAILQSVGIRRMSGSGAA